VPLAEVVLQHGFAAVMAFSTSWHFPQSLLQENLSVKVYRLRANVAAVLALRRADLCRWRMPSLECHGQHASAPLSLAAKFRS